MFEKLDVIDSKVATLAALSDNDLATYDGPALGDAILRLDTTIRRLEAIRLQVTRVHSRSMAWKAEGAKSPSQWHRDRRNLSGGQAASQVDTAHGLADLPRTAAGLAAGTVSTAQAMAATRTRQGLTDDQLGELDELVAETAPAATDRQLRDAVVDFTHRIAPDAVAERERQAFDRRGVRLGRASDGGWWIDGRLDVLGGETLATALSTLTTPRGEDDDRTAEQRRADALADLADRALRAGDLPAEGGLRPHVAVTADLATLEGRAGAPAGRLDHAGPISGDTVRQVACDAGVHRVVTDGPSEVLDVGRATRTVSRAQRRALIARDRGCVGCNAPPGWTEAHHIWHWADGGPTDLDNLALLCRSCHTGVHHREWRIVRDGDNRPRVRRPRRRRRDAPAGDRSSDDGPSDDQPPSDGPSGGRHRAARTSDEGQSPKDRSPVAAECDGLPEPVSRASQPLPANGHAATANRHAATANSHAATTRPLTLGEF